MSHNQSNYSATIMATYQYANQNNEEDNYEETQPVNSKKMAKTCNSEAYNEQEQNGTAN